MGLSMVYGFARQSGGELAIESRVGEGTKVQLYLPRAVGTSAGGGGGTDEEGMALPARILLIEDDAGVRDVVVSMLSELGYIVSAVPDGEAGLAGLGRGGPTALSLTAILLPGHVG